MKVAIYQPADKPMAIVSFAPDADVMRAAKQSIPSGIPFWLVPKLEVDALYAEQGEWRDAWEIDQDAIGRGPDGVGEA
ncbi:hypothetical protein [Stutzerimonas nitrititolerans]|uniref:hypothetical protein n=1 Tax=Stutzerimonas nitrititolerans TaxID=2482751 RepID=UPI0028A92F68|nr:hypothetical protein [Stutzerimonas nitrititolerans]